MRFPQSTSVRPMIVIVLSFAFIFPVATLGQRPDASRLAAPISDRPARTCRDGFGPTSAASRDHLTGSFSRARR